MYVGHRLRPRVSLSVCLTLQYFGWGGLIIGRVTEFHGRASEWCRASQACGPTQMGAQYRDARRVRFSNVVIRTHTVILDGSKLPSDGCAPLGLGAPVGEALTRSVDEHETQRAAGSPGVRLVSTEDRRDTVGDDAAELFALERNNQEIILQACGAQADDDSSSLFESRECSPETSFQADQAGSSGSETPGLSTYSTAAADAERSGHGGGFCELDEEAEAGRKRRALDAAEATETRKAEKRRCKSCRRFACICC